MTNVLTLLRRELGHTFRSALAYVFLVLFVVIVQLLYLLTFFQEQNASMSRFFEFLPWLVVIFAALVTMRSWAEERQENTFEMLLTFPMKDWELVIAKWLATFLFLIVGIACTLTLPMMVAALGEPDPGPIVSGYAGAVLIAAMWCATGVFFSGLTRSQLLAALASFVLGMASLFLGTQEALLLIDAKAQGVGSLLNSMVGTWSHYSAMSRGVIELADVLFFVVWVAVFLYLNVLYIGWRRRPQRELVLAVCTFLAIGCGLLGSRLLSDTSIARIDMTEEGLYTLSEGTVAILRKADVPVQATLYISPREQMPSGYEDLEQDLRNRLDEMRLRSGGMLDIHVLHMSAANLAARPEAEVLAEEGRDEVQLTEDEKIEKRLAERGVQPFQVASYEATRVAQEWIYATLGLTYREKDEELIHQMVPERLPDLESLVAGTVSRLVRDAPPRIALHLGKQPMDPQLEQMYRQQGQPLPDPYSQIAGFLQQQKFDVVRIGLTQHEPMPADYDALVLIGPVELDDRGRYEVNKALVSGKPVLIAAQRFGWDYPRSTNGAISIRREDVDPGLDAVLSPQGVNLSTDILMQDKGKFVLTLPPSPNNLLERMRGSGPRVDPPMHILVAPEQINTDHAITERLAPVNYLWGSALDLNEERLAALLLESTTLLSTTNEAWQIPADIPLRTPHLQPKGQAFGTFPLMVEVVGQFQDTFAGQPRPKWTPKLEMSRDGRPLPAPPDLAETAIVPGPGRLIIAGSASMWRNGILGSPGNRDLLVNSLSALTLDPELATVRSKTARSRQFEEPSSAKHWFWMAVPLGVVPVLIIAIGLSIGIGRMRTRERWNAQHGR